MNLQDEEKSKTKKTIILPSRTRTAFRASRFVTRFSKFIQTDAKFINNRTEKRTHIETKWQQHRCKLLPEKDSTESPLQSTRIIMAIPLISISR